MSHDILYDLLAFIRFVLINKGEKLQRPQKVQPDLDS